MHCFTVETVCTVLFTHRHCIVKLKYEVHVFMVFLVGLKERVNLQTVLGEFGLAPSVERLQQD